MYVWRINKMSFYLAIQGSDGNWSIFNNENCEVKSNIRTVANQRLSAGAKFVILDEAGRDAVIETGKLSKGHETFESAGIQPVEEFLASRAMSSDRSWPWKRARGDEK